MDAMWWKETLTNAFITAVIAWIVQRSFSQLVERRETYEGDVVREIVDLVRGIFDAWLDKPRL